MTPRELIGRFYEELNRRDLDAAMRLVHPDFIEHWPQSDERVVGSENLRSIIENYPGGVTFNEPSYHGRDDEWAMAPNFTVVRITDAGNSGTGVLKVRYPDGSQWWMVALFEMKDDMLYRQTSFFAAPFEAPEWRATWVQRDSTKTPID